MKEDCFKALFWGALWGLSEATLGYVAHVAALAIPGLPGFLMFPIAFFFMDRVAKDTGSCSSIMLAASVAALIKLSDFLLPAHDAIRIVNPALSILLEGLAVNVFMTRMRKGSVAKAFTYSFAMGLSWRVAFLVYLRLISLFGLPAALATSGPAVALRFAVVESLANALLISMLMIPVSEKVVPTSFRATSRPVIVAAVVTTAVVAQILI